MRYSVCVGDDTVELEVERGPDGNYRVRGSDGSELSVTVQANHAGLVSVVVDGQNVEVQPREAEARFRGERYSVRAESWLERAATRPVGSNGAQAQRLVASMPGRIVRVLCQAGAAVQEGSPLIVMEAMKMQNELCAKHAAVVRAVRVNVGETVERGETLIEFE